MRIKALKCLHIPQWLILKGILYKADLDLDFQKSAARTFRKSGPYTKIRCMRKKVIIDKCDDAYFKYDNDFMKF